MKKKKEINPVTGLTVTQENQRAKKALRQMWRKTSRAHHIKQVRVPHPDPDSPFKYAVYCEMCYCYFGQSERVTYTTSTGRRRRTGAYQVDHKLKGYLPPVKDLRTDLGIYADELLHTEVRVLCVECHRIVTQEQSLYVRDCKQKENS